jgi:VIT1/CCC1 family predicted Fe2+/Mn2+ transporter
MFWLLEARPYSRGHVMAAGEYVSVHSQADTEKADLERKELREDDEGEHRELARIYIARGLDPSLAKQVAEQLMAHAALAAHARNELAISETLAARPVQAALSSAASFAVGAMLPLLAVILAPQNLIVPVVAGPLCSSFAALGAWAASAGGASVIKGAMRVTFWGARAMAVTTSVGALFGSVP